MKATQTQLDVAEAAVLELPLDPAHTLVEFAVKHLMITTVKGRFRDVRGSILLHPEDPARSTVAVEMLAGSIDTGVADRDEHLRSSDFLDADHFPVVEFRSRRIEGSFRNPGDRFRIVGDLTIRGAAREVALDATYEGEAIDPSSGTRRLSFGAETRIDRRDFGLTWNETLETGGLLVGNEVRIYLQAQAEQAREVLS